MGATLSPTTPSQVARRERIVTTATDLLNERGYDKVQMRHVAEGADVALGTLYRYFPSKEHLYATVLLEWSETYEPRKSSGLAARSTDRERLRAALRQAVRAYERNPHFYRLIMVLEVVTDPNATEVYVTFTSRFRGALRESLLTTDVAEAQAIVLVASSVLGSLLRSWSLGRTSIDQVYARLDIVVDLIFR